MRVLHSHNFSPAIGFSFRVGYYLFKSLISILKATSHEQHVNQNAFVSVSLLF
jgi:hypothetical protein